MFKKPFSRIQGGMVMALILGLAHVSVARAADAAPDPAVAKDLGSVIALLGLPCGEVVKVQNRGANDNLASCKDGNRYRVYVNADGRVVAEKQK